MFARDSYLTMTIPSIPRVLIHTAAIGGITLFWVTLTENAYRAVSMLANKMFAHKVSQDRERRRKIKQEVREEIKKIEQKALDELAPELSAPRSENSGHSPVDL